ncbi:TPA: hypothetical protein I7294_22805 [Vibrio parahaemolyticus]|nr:hypothetical protein [Vibrio parahaemolyticus]
MFGDKTLSLTTVFVLSSRLSAMNLFFLRFDQQYLFSHIPNPSKFTT